MKKRLFMPTWVAAKPSPCGSLDARKRVVICSSCLFSLGVQETTGLAVLLKNGSGVVISFM